MSPLDVFCRRFFDVTFDGSMSIGLDVVVVLFCVVNGCFVVVVVVVVVVVLVVVVVVAFNVSLF